MSNTPTARERQLHVAHQVRLYQRQPSAAEHERLLPLIGEVYGPLAAEFFDEEDCLPLQDRTGPGSYPWPMRQEETVTYAVSVLMCALLVVLIVSLGLAIIIPFIPALLIGIAAGFAVWFAASPVIGRFFPPKDLSERQALVGAFAQVQERHQRTAEAEAARARQARQFQRIVEDRDPEHE